MATMADLMASLENKRVSFSRGDSIQGEILAISDSEVIVDLGTKAEGVLSKRDFLPEQLEKLKVGDKIQAFVATSENDSGQINLTLFRQVSGGKRAEEQLKKWQKFVTAQQRQTTLMGKVAEVNKGGLLVEVEKVRGFVPSSQVSAASMEGLNLGGDLVGQELKLKVLEIDPGNNRLVFSARGEVSEETKEELKKVEVGKTVKGKVVGIAPFGLFIDLFGLEGMVFAQEVSWEDEGANLQTAFKIGQEIESKVIGKDENLGRLNLSLRQLSEDPFASLTEDYQADDVVKGTVKELTDVGALVTLEKGVEGLVPVAKIEQGNPYTIGQTTNFLVDSIDSNRRRINLAPFLTSTVGLIYK